MSNERTNAGGTPTTEEFRHYPDDSALLVFETGAMVLVERHATYAPADEIGRVKLADEKKASAEAGLLK